MITDLRARQNIYENPDDKFKILLEYVNDKIETESKQFQGSCIIYESDIVGILGRMITTTEEWFLDKLLVDNGFKVMYSDYWHIKWI